MTGAVRGRDRHLDGVSFGGVTGVVDETRENLIETKS